MKRFRARVAARAVARQAASGGGLVAFSPLSISGCVVWLDGGDNSTMNSTTAVTQWRDKSGQSNTMTGSGTWSGGKMVFNGSTNAFSNTGFVFPYASYSLFAVYSNTTAPASTAYMNVVYGSNGYPMIGVYDSNQYVTARSVVGNTGALTTIANAGWATRMGSTSYDGINSIAADALGNVFVFGQNFDSLNLYNAGGSLATTISGGGIYFAKYSSTGTLVWTNRMSVGALATDTSGNLFLAGYYPTPSLCNLGTSTVGATLPGSTVNFLAKYSSDGTVVWAAPGVGGSVSVSSLGDVSIGGGYSSALTFSNATAIGGVGPTLPFTSGSVNGYVAKYSSTGAVSWAAQFTGTGAGTDLGILTATDGSGNVFVGGHYNMALTFSNATSIGGVGATLPTAVGYDGYIAKYSLTGTALWAAQITGTSTETVAGIGADSSGNVYVTGYYSSAMTFSNATTIGGVGATLSAPSALDCYIAKYSSTGTVVWVARITSGTNDIGIALTMDTTGNVIVTGYHNSTLTLSNANTIGGAGPTINSAGGATDCFVAKYSPSGVVLWANQIGSSGSDSGRGVAVDGAGNVFVGGYYQAALTLYNADGTTGATLPTSTGDVDLFIAKYSPAGFITSSPVPANSNVIVGTTYSPSTALIPYTNGVSMTALSGTVAATTGLYLGGSSNYFNGTLSELVVFSNALSSSQRQQIEGYLAWKWGLQGSLPGTHVFRSVALTSSNATLASPLYYEVTPADWTQSWQPYLQSLATANAGAVATATLNAITASGSNYQGLVLAPNGYIYCITTGATSIGYINPATGQFGTFGSATSGGYVSGVLAPNGNIYCVNFFGGPIGIISPGSSPSLSTFSATGPTMAGYYSLSSAVGPDGLIYMPSTGASNVGVYNPTTNMYNTTYLTNIGIITGGYLGAVLGPNGKIYCIPGSATNVGVIDPIARTFTVAGVNVTGSATGYRGGVLAPNGKIYCLPQNNTKVGVIDPVAGTFTDALITNVGSFTKPYMSGTLGPDGNIYCTPEASLPMAVINVNANTISTFGASILTTNGAILAPNGTIYTAPTSSSAINTITFTGLSQLPSSNYCLSAWANKI